MKSADKKEPISKKLGEKVERPDEKNSRVSLEKLGATTSRTADKLEPSANHKSEKHNDK